MTPELSADFEKRYPAGAVVRAAFSQPASGFSVTVLFGPSGSGKTTVLRCLAGLERPERGTIRFGGETWLDADAQVYRSPQDRDVGYLFQEYALFPHLTVAGNIGFSLAGLPAGERRRRVEEALDRFGLAGLGDRYPHQVSGGQQQRVALARTMARQPRLLLLDEPLSALDAALREQVRRELRRVLSDAGVPVIVVTHDRTETIALADFVVVMDEGRVRQAGPLEEVFSRPSDHAVAQIVGVETVAAGRIVGVREGLATVAVGGAELVALAPDANAGDVYVCIRAEEVMLVRGDPGVGSARNRLPARVISVEPEGPMMRVGIDCGFPLEALVTRPACEELNLRAGEPITVLVKAPAIHLVQRGR